MRQRRRLHRGRRRDQGDRRRAATSCWRASCSAPAGPPGPAESGRRSSPPTPGRTRSTTCSATRRVKLRLPVRGHRVRSRPDTFYPGGRVEFAATDTVNVEGTFEASTRESFWHREYSVGLPGSISLSTCQATRSTRASVRSTRDRFGAGSSCRGWSTRTRPTCPTAATSAYPVPAA